MKIPFGYTEQQVLEIIERSANILAPSFAFGSYEVDDIKQECVLMVIDLLDKETYDPKRPLGNYVFCHLRKRLINLSRDKLRRTDSPCKDCHQGRPCKDGRICSRYAKWLKLQERKSSLARSVGLDGVKEDVVCTREAVVEEAGTAEMLRMIDEELPVDLRQTYLQMRAGVSVAREQRDEVEAKVKEILGWQPNEDD